MRRERGSVRKKMNSGEEGKGLLWKLPVVKLKDVGKIGPGFGFGAGCGLGFGLGLIGGAGFGPGIPGLQLGLGVGVGCGVGIGFGYGVGKGVAYDESRRYSNIGKPPFRGSYVPSQDEIGPLLDELVLNTKRLVGAASKEIDKWRR